MNDQYILPIFLLVFWTLWLLYIAREYRRFKRMNEEERKEYIRKTSSHSFWLWVEGKIVMNARKQLDIQNAKDSVGKLLPMYDEEGHRKIPTMREGMRKLDEDRKKRIEQVR